MMLEAAADAWAGPPDPPYDFAITVATPIDVDLRPTIRAIVEDVRRGEPQPRISARFHTTLVAIIAAICRRMRADLTLDRVCLSGGCFQNARLLEGCVQSLRDDGFTVYFQQAVPANDGGIALGQAAIACEILRGGA